MTDIFLNGNSKYWKKVIALQNNHWTLLFVSVKNNLVFYINSFGTSCTTQEQARSNWTTFCNKRDWKLNKIKWSTYDTSNQHIIQTDSFNCGVYVCYLFKLLIESKYDQLNFDKNIFDYRNDILQRFIDKSDEKLVKKYNENLKKKNNTSHVSPSSSIEIVSE